MLSALLVFALAPAPVCLRLQGDSASFDAFKNWLLRDGQGMCAKGADGVRRCVIVS